MSKKYWFLEDSEYLSDKLSSHHDSWMSYGSNVMAQNWVRNSIAYYSTILEAQDWQTSLGFDGDSGELVKMVIPQARGFIREIVTLATKQRLYFKTIAESNDSDVLTATRLGNALCESIVYDQSLDRKREHVVEGASVFGMAFYAITWRSDKGTPYAGTVENSTDADGNEFKTPIVHYDGDLEIQSCSIYDICWDTRVHDWDELNWAERRTKKNRWDLIASYPDMEQDILKIPCINEEQYILANQGEASDNEDLIYVYECYHKPTPALPKGRMIVYSDKNTIFYDDVNPYECIPIVQLKPEPIQGMSFGYPKLNDLLPVQEMFDACYSAVATNNAALGVQSILCPREANISPESINGMNWIYYTPTSEPGGGAPRPLQLTQSAPEIYKLLPMMKQEMMELSHLNSALRGAPPPGVTSGTAIATLSANALEFMNSLSKAEQMVLERVMQLSIWFYSKFASIERILSVTSKSNQMFAKQFKGSDLESIKKVRALVSNPLMNTIGGRADVAEKMLQSGMIKDAQQYFRVLEGAPPEIMFEDDVSQADLIARENEALLDGRPVMALKTDDHAKHIMHHASLLNDPMVRMNGEQVGKILDHMDEHENLAKTMDPFLAGMIATGKVPQMPPPPMGGPPPGGPGGPPLPPPPGPGGPISHPPGAPGGDMPMPTNKPAVPTPDQLGRMR